MLVAAPDNHSLNRLALELGESYRTLRELERSSADYAMSFAEVLALQRGQISSATDILAQGSRYIAFDRNSGLELLDIARRAMLMECQTTDRTLSSFKKEINNLVGEGRTLFLKIVDHHKQEAASELAAVVDGEYLPVARRQASSLSHFADRLIKPALNIYEFDRSTIRKGIADYSIKAAADIFLFRQEFLLSVVPYVVEQANSPDDFLVLAARIELQSLQELFNEDFTHHFNSVRGICYWHEAPDEIKSLDDQRISFEVYREDDQFRFREIPFKSRQ